jgi:hypothetical protein
MDISASAIAGTLRVGLQVVVSQKRPVIEVYQETINQFGPEKVFGEGKDRQSHRFQDIAISFVVVNIGAVRAENVVLTIGGSFERQPPLKFGELFGHEIRQMAPGQAMFLFRLHASELNKYEDSKPIGLKDDRLTIRYQYNGPWSGLNRISRLPSWLRGRTQYRGEYEFHAKSVATDLPPPKYAT